MNQVIKIKWIGIYISLFLLMSCVSNISSFEESLTDKNFTLIYDNNTFESIDAVDIKPTDDGGYIILGKYSNTSQDTLIKEITYLLKINDKGLFEWDTRKNPEFNAYKAPVGELIIKGNNYYFACVKNKQTTFLEVNGETKKIKDLIALTEGSEVERCVPTKDGGYLLLSNNYNCFAGKEQAISLHKINADNTRAWKKCFDKGSESGITQPDIEKYYNCGEFFDKGKSYIFCNAFFNNRYATGILDSTGNLLFTLNVPNTGNLPYQINQIGDHLFAATLTNFRDVYLTQGFDILPETKQCAVTNLSLFHEINPAQKIFGIPAKIKNQDVFICGMDLREYIMAVYIINPTKTGPVLLGKRTIGNNRIYEYKSLCRSKDGGVMVLGTTYVGLRFARILVSKITKENLESLIP